MVLESFMKAPRGKFWAFEGFTKFPDGKDRKEKGAEEKTEKKGKTFGMKGR